MIMTDALREYLCGILRQYHGTFSEEKLFSTLSHFSVCVHFTVKGEKCTENFSWSADEDLPKGGPVQKYLLEKARDHVRKMGGEIFETNFFVACLDMREIPIGEEYWH